MTNRYRLSIIKFKRFPYLVILDNLETYVKNIFVYDSWFFRLS